jgi:hypothetical protein
VVGTGGEGAGDEESGFSHEVMRANVEEKGKRNINKVSVTIYSAQRQRLHQRLE